MASTYAYSADAETERRYQNWLSRFGAEDAGIYGDVCGLLFKHRAVLPPLMGTLIDRLRVAVSRGVCAAAACGELHQCLTGGSYARRSLGMEERLVPRSLQYAYGEVAGLSERSFEFGMSVVCDLYERLMGCFNPDISVEYGAHFAENATSLEDLLGDLCEMSVAERERLVGWQIGVRKAMSLDEE